jgi:hypothetical protein
VIENDNPPMTQIYHAPEGKFHYEHGFPSGYHLMAKETERSSVYRVERLNGTKMQPSQRTKMQRARKKMKTPIAEGQSIQYNFIKAHMVLEAQTSAQTQCLQLFFFNLLLNRSQ